MIDKWGSEVRKSKKLLTTQGYLKIKNSVNYTHVLTIGTDNSGIKVVEMASDDRKLRNLNDNA